MDHVAGFCTGGDISERRVQAKEGPGCAKSFDTFTPLGPWLVTRDELTDAGGAWHHHRR
ncbi:MAG: fumarylacetoacetate hydrolase family protein [Bauldia sp.]